MEEHTCNVSIQKAEVGGSWVPGQPGIHSETLFQKNIPQKWTIVCSVGLESRKKNDWKIRDKEVLNRRMWMSLGNGMKCEDFISHINTPENPQTVSYKEALNNLVNKIAWPADGIQSLPATTPELTRGTHKKSDYV
jgi:hypothetical protein